MDRLKTSAIEIIDEKEDLLTNMSDAIWDHPEVGYTEKFAADLFCKALEGEGFSVLRNLADIPTAFSGTFGSGKPVIGFLGEFDALPGLSQQAGCTEKTPVVLNGAGHGCGHNLLGVGSFAAALATKKYLEESGISGTVVFFGCPAEEGGAGKGFMARDGVFDELDLAISWHPGEVHSVATESTMANYQICYKFYGTSSHAAMSPEMGRSALDALELMNTGVQYLREHMPMYDRVHYAITNTGGSAPGIVQPYAEALYLMRAPSLKEAKELYQRVNLCASGAATMTETRVEIEFVKACSNMVLNTTINKVLQKNLEEIPAPKYSEEDFALAKEMRTTQSNKYSYFEDLLNAVTDPYEYEALAGDVGKDIHTVVMPLAPESQGFPSSDVGDVSWVCPVGQIGTATMPACTAMHSWQEVAVGKSGIAHKGTLFAGKVMAGAAIDLFNDPVSVKKAQDEKKLRTKNQPFVSPIPKETKPRFPKN